MKLHSKLQKLKKYKKAIRNKIINNYLQISDQTYEQYSLLPPNTPPNIQPPASTPPPLPQEEEEEFQTDENFNMSEYLQYLSDEQRDLIKQYNPDLPAIYFMSKKQKKRYFDQINNNFKKKIQKAPQRRSKNNKNLKFRNQFEIKYFGQTQKVSVVKNRKNEYEAYHKQLHFS